MKQSLQATPMFYIYSGHGTHLLDSKGKTVSSGIAAPYYVLPDGYFASGITYNHIPDLHNQTPYPMGFGFSCLLNTYDVNDNFGAKWLSSYEGGVSMYGSTTVSYSSPNGKSSKRMFKTFKKLTNRINNFPISLWLRLGEYDYFGACPNGTRGKQISRYNLIGDPTLYVYGMSDNGDIAPFHMPHQNDISFETEESDIVQINLYDINGHLLRSLNNDNQNNLNDLQSGIYITESVYKDGNILIGKIIK